jgi:hypothetical protein
VALASSSANRILLALLGMTAAAIGAIDIDTDTAAVHNQSDARLCKGGRTLRGGAREIRPQSRAHALHRLVDARAHTRQTAAVALMIIIVMLALAVGIGIMEGTTRV